MSELISVLLPVYKERLDWVQNAIESILGQSYKNIELIVCIDNPDRADVINWIDTLDDERVDVYVNERNIGLVQNLNQGIGRCHGEYIARMDADDISMVNRFKMQLQYLKNNHLDIVASNVIRIDCEGKRIGETNLILDPENAGIYLRRLGSLPHPTWLGRKEIFLKLKGYRDIKLAEDYDFLIRCFLMGGRMGILYEPTVYYRQNLEGITQMDKGKQRITALLLRKQLLAGTVFDTKMISDALYKEKKRVVKRRKCYAYSRYVRNVIIGKEKLNLTRIFNFRLYYVFILFEDFMVERLGR